MAVTLSARRAPSGNGRRRRTVPMSDINVTPLVDVMLVLLVVFMITAPLLTAGVEVDLPQTRANPIAGQDQPLSVSVDAAGTIFLQSEAIDLADLPAKLAAVSGRNPDLRVFVRGDRAIDYGRVMSVVGAIHGAGFNRVALITETDAGAKGPARP